MPMTHLMHAYLLSSNCDAGSVDGGTTAFTVAAGTGTTLFLKNIYLFMAVLGLSCSIFGFCLVVHVTHELLCSIWDLSFHTSGIQTHIP